MSKPMTNSMGKEELKDRLDDWKHDVDEFGLLHHDGWICSKCGNECEPIPIRRLK